LQGPLFQSSPLGVFANQRGINFDFKCPEGALRFACSIFCTEGNRYGALLKSGSGLPMDRKDENRTAPEDWLKNQGISARQTGVATVAAGRSIERIAARESQCETSKGPFFI
jgi:hypothetical protein